MKIHSIFVSINGEINFTHQGSIATFIRTYGCNCRCSYCDSAFSYEGKFETMKVDEIVSKVQTINVTITGGEPLLQKQGVISLIEKLLWEGHLVSVETNGSTLIPFHDISTRGLAHNLSWVVDYKLPSSKMENRMRIGNFELLSSRDFVKFVVATREDFDKAVLMMKWMNTLYHEGIPMFAFSPCFGKLEPSLLAQWMLNDEYVLKTEAIYNLQIHKILGVV